MRPAIPPPISIFSLYLQHFSFNCVHLNPNDICRTYVRCKCTHFIANFFSLFFSTVHATLFFSIALRFHLLRPNCATPIQSNRASKRDHRHRRCHPWVYNAHSYMHCYFFFNSYRLPAPTRSLQYDNNDDGHIVKVCNSLSMCLPSIFHPSIRQTNFLALLNSWVYWYVRYTQ